MSISKTKEYYDKNAERWSSIKTNSFFHEKQFRIFEELLDKGDRVLDIGCAYGIHVPLFLGIGRKLKYEGVDISKSMVGLAQSRYPQLKFTVSNILDLRSSKKYDAFWAAAVLMHVPQDEWPQMLDSIESKMKKRAIGYITLPSERPSPASKKDQRHFETFDKNKFKKIASSRDWKILKTGNFKGLSTEMVWHWYIVELP